MGQVRQRGIDVEQNGAVRTNRMGWAVIYGAKGDKN